MQTRGLIPVLFLLLPLASTAQVRRTIQAVGSATISAPPDQVKVDIGVSTTGTSAQDASSQNATLMTAVLAAIRQVLGPSANIQTIGFSITPNYRPNTSPPMVIGYTATNTVQVTSNGADVNPIVKVIDAATAAGATNINSLRFAISNDDTVRQEALGAAAKEAMAHAQAIATGLGAHVGSVIAAQEGVSVTPLVGVTAAPTASTPVEPGLVQVTANVTISVELTP